MDDLDEEERQAIDAARDQCRPDDFAQMAAQAEKRIGDRIDALNDAAHVLLFHDALELSEEERRAVRDAVLFVQGHAFIGTLPGLMARWYGEV